jgi:lipoyl-dependent peroxiredoxin subunit D
MSLALLRSALPAYAEDLARNLDVLAAETILSDQQKWGAFLASAFASGTRLVVQSVLKEIDGKLSVEAQTGAKAAAAILAMNTVYYSAVNLLHNHDYRAEPPRLSMEVLARPGVDKIDFEMWSLAVAAVSRCAACLNTHESELHKRGVTLERVQAVLRIAAVVAAVSAVLRAEAAAA